MKLAALDEVQAHYALGLEHARLDQPFGSVEFERTKAVVLRALPASPATVADVGAGRAGTPNGSRHSAIASCIVMLL